MTSRDFCYWLQGYFEIEAERAGEKAPALGSDQVKSIKKHLALVFKHEIDPSAGPPAHQAELDAIHHGADAAALKAEIETLKKQIQALSMRPSGPMVMRC